MGANTKIIKRRIKSVSSTKKITKAMEMISAVKMRRAVANVLATRSYANLAWQMLLDVSKKTDTSLHPLLATRAGKKIGLIFITSNRGMAGGFSSKLLSEVHSFINQKGSVDIILLGKRGRKIFTYFHHNIASEYKKIDLTTKIEEVSSMSRSTIKEYLNGKYDELWVAYMNFVSAIKQNSKIKKVLPIEKTDPLALEKSFEKNTEFLFEPTPEIVLNVLLPRLVEMQIYQAILESDASEHSARMLAMANASDAANDIIKELNYTFNKARQSTITQEIAEIVGGAAALE